MAKAEVTATLKQLLKEFWIPLLLALGWTWYSSHSAKEYGAKSLIQAFAPAFFLFSWMTGQVVRVRKQARVETGMNSMEERLKGLVGQIELRTNQLIGYATGGDSFCYLSLDKGSGVVVAIHQGTYPLYDVMAKIVDLDKSAEDPNHAIFDINYRFEVGGLSQGSVKSFPLAKTLLPKEAGSKRFNIFIVARNGHFVEELRIVKIDGEWAYAMKIEGVFAEKNPLLAKIDEKFPLNERGEVAW